MNINDVIELEVERMSFGPAAIGRILAPGSHRPMVIFVTGALPDEKISARLLRNHKTYWEAELIEVLRPSPERVSPPCPVFGSCGGCQWQHLSYPAQIRAKEEILLYQLSRATRLSIEDLRSKLTVHPAKSPFGYRSRLQAHGNRKGIGFFAAGSHSIVHTEKCLVAHEDIQKTWSAFLKTRPLEELSKATGQFKVEWMRTENGQVKEAFNLKHGAFGFTQINLEQNKILTQVVARIAGSGQVLMDLYGGDGNLSHALTQWFRQVISVDSFNEGLDPTTITPPLKTGRTFIRERVEDFLLNRRWSEWKIQKIDCLIVDPPRNGLREAADLLLNLQAPRMVLVSCDPSTLARDLTAFIGPYKVDSIDLIDMFPQTFHMEAVIGCSSTKSMN